jgi:hypothetical protein
VSVTWTFRQISADECRQLAEKHRKRADDARDSEQQTQMRAIAAEYEKLADAIEVEREDPRLSSD